MVVYTGGEGYHGSGETYEGTTGALHHSALPLSPAVGDSYLDTGGYDHDGAKGYSELETDYDLETPAYSVEAPLS